MSALLITPLGLARRALEKFLRKVGRWPPVSPFQRTLTEDEATDLATILSRVFTRKIGAADVFTVVDLVNRFEHRMTGRIAGDVQDYVLNYFMVTTAAEREPTIERAHVEIGVLFGGGLLLSAHALMSIGSRNRIIGIDPLSGYYGNRRDPVTGLRVRASTVHQNFHRVGLDAQRYELIVARSDDRAASEALAGVELASVWIDGDHSYQGVRSDWLTYSPLVCRGGFVLFDNYGDGVFPDIDRFIEDELLPDLEGWEVVIHLGRSILLRKL